MKISKITLVIGGLALVFAMTTPSTSLSKPQRTFVLPEQAVKISDNVYDLGKAIDHNGKQLQGYAILHPRQNKAKPDHAGGPKDKGGSTKCYATYGKSVKWYSPEPYLVDGTNSAGINALTIESKIADSISTWENQVAGEIFGNQVNGIVDGADTVTVDNKNEVLFADISGSGTIAVTIVWGVFGGPPSGRYLAEWDMVFDDTDYDWSLTGEAGKMDFENIAVHELGHALGLDHAPGTCLDETMYAYADYGETKKRDLNPGDIAGVQSLY